MTELTKASRTQRKPPLPQLRLRRSAAVTVAAAECVPNTTGTASSGGPCRETHTTRENAKQTVQCSECTSAPHSRGRGRGRVRRIHAVRACNERARKRAPGQGFSIVVEGLQL